MKLGHKLNGWAPDRTDPEWADRVEREAERTTNAAEARHRKAQERLERAVAKAKAAEAAQEAGRRTRRVESLWAEVERRRDELRALESIANRSPAGSQNRGSGSHRGVPNPSSGL